MIDIVRDFLSKYEIKNKPVVIAFSSGPDSCALARLLNDLKDEFNIDITLAYFNHMWREEAKNEEDFTIRFANKFNLKYILGSAPLNIQKNEETARDLRYRFLYEVSRKCNTDVIFLAHNKNDNIETLIYRIIKGTSPKGLCSILPKRDIFYRPLLSVEKNDILNYLDKISQEYLTDSSNSDIKYKRNFIRKEILPLFEKINPNYLNNIDNLITTSNFASKIIENSILNLLNKISVDNVIKRSEYITLSVEYRYEILNMYIGDKLKYRDFKTIKKLDDFIMQNPHSKTSLNKKEFLRTRKDKIFIEENLCKEPENE